MCKFKHVKACMQSMGSLRRPLIQIRRSEGAVFKAQLRTEVKQFTTLAELIHNSSHCINAGVCNLFYLSNEDPLNVLPIPQ